VNPPPGERLHARAIRTPYEDTTPVLLLMLTLLAPAPDRFTVQAAAEYEYVVDRPRESLRGRADDLSLFARNMPGVVGVMAAGEDTYLYRTARSVPFSDDIRLAFLLRRTVEGDSVTVYRSADSLAADYMECRVRMRAEGSGRTAVGVRLLLRMSRENGSDIHLLAPVMGERFLSSRMESDLEEMLETFAGKAAAELHAAIPAVTASLHEAHP